MVALICIAASARPSALHAQDAKSLGPMPVRPAPKVANTRASSVAAVSAKQVQVPKMGKAAPAKRAGAETPRQPVLVTREKKKP